MVEIRTSEFWTDVDAHIYEPSCVLTHIYYFSPGLEVILGALK